MKAWKLALLTIPALAAAACQPTLTAHSDAGSPGTAGASAGIVSSASFQAFIALLLVGGPRLPGHPRKRAGCYRYQVPCQA